MTSPTVVPMDTFIQEPQSKLWLTQLVIMIMIMPALCLYLTTDRWQNRREAASNTVQEEKPKQEVPDRLRETEPMNANTITPLHELDWASTKPLQLRPFKPKYHLTMAIENATVNDLVYMDRDYLSRLAIRRQIFDKHTATVLGSIPRVKPAVDELYTWMVNTYLPQRFPTIFTLANTPISESTASPRPQHCLRNVATNETLLATPFANPSDSLRTLGSHIDSDMLILLPTENAYSTEPTTETTYTLAGFQVCMPNGFNTASKLNLTLANIHGPVPCYKEKLEKSMDRFFARIAVGQYARRANWTITTRPDLYAASGNHAHDGEAVQKEEVDPDHAWVRSELQILWRLPETKALVFMVKTYMYTLRQIKEEDMGEELATAIEGMEAGSVPEVYEYKRGIAWGESAKSYLRI